jgi:hypothetical protein
VDVSGPPALSVGLVRALGAVRAAPSSAAFTVVLLLHVAAALIGMVTLAVGAAAAGRLLATRHGPPPASVRSYFSPGENWAGRALYAVPVFGFALVGLSRGADSAGDTWVVAGLVMWIVAVALAEATLWPAERRVRRVLAAMGALDGSGVVDGPGAAGSPGAVPGEAVRACRTIVWSSAAVFAVLVAAMVVMFARP